MLGVLTFVFLPCFASSARGATSNNQAAVIVFVGAAGEEEYGNAFTNWAAAWAAASEKGGETHLTIGLGPTNETSDLSALKQALAGEPTNSTAELWLVLIGHGTFDGKEARFNLRGPDLSATELADWLKPFRRPVVVINCTSASSPFLNKLSGPNRIIVTATRSGYEQNITRFGKYISNAITNLTADLDKDGQTSLLEAFVMASRQTHEFYETEGRLATEHALLDDNGDGLGTQGDWFRGVRAVKKPAEGATVDGLHAHQIHLIRSEQEMKMPPEVRARRDELELAVAKLRESKQKFGDDEYYRQLENLMLELAKLYAVQPQSATN